eukprot:GILI01022115.1.p1 GENE.GILI01022115.1~~GILI01022115.1.p1  ORF type:complete len:370 (+),score=59.88 GILI01022115.1:60-1169(+)
MSNNNSPSGMKQPLTQPYQSFDVENPRKETVREPALASFVRLFVYSSFMYVALLTLLSEIYRYLYYDERALSNVIWLCVIGALKLLSIRRCYVTSHLNYLDTVQRSHYTYTLKKRHGNGQQRFCRQCELPKPDRTHHCIVCRRCVLQMDHHDGWMRCCVGESNYKAFLLVLFYTVLFFTSSTLILLLHSDQSPVHSVFRIIASCFSALISTATTLFFSHHFFKLVRLNRTSIEDQELYGSHPEPGTLERRRQLEQITLGTPLENYKRVMGQWYLWLIPFKDLAELLMVIKYTLTFGHIRNVSARASSTPSSVSLSSASASSSAPGALLTKDSSYFVTSYIQPQPSRSNSVVAGLSPIPLDETNPSPDEN